MSEPRGDDDAVRELMALEAVGALDAAERTDLEAALAERPDLRPELDLLRQSAAAMADAMREEPPVRLRGSVLAAIATTAQLPATTADRPETSEPRARTPAPPTAPVAPVVPIGRRRRWFPIAAAAAALIGIAAGAVIAFVMDDDVGPSDRIAAVLDDAGATTIQMPGELPGLSIVYSPDEQAAVLTADDLPVPEGERVYQLWAIRGSDPPEPVDIFRPNEDGEVQLLLEGIDPASAVWAVTREPPGGSAAPTPPILNATA